MEEKVFFHNETIITNKIYKSMVFFSNLSTFYKYIVILKLAFCSFLITSTILLNMNLSQKIFYIFISILGIIDTFEVKDEKPEYITKLEYKFFEYHLQIDNSKSLVEIPYNNIKSIIGTKQNYYVICDGLLLILSKDGFITGTKESFKKFIYNKKKIATFPEQ